MTTILDQQETVVSTGYSLPPTLKERLAQEAKKNNRSASNLLAVILADYFARLDAEEASNGAARKGAK